MKLREDYRTGASEADKAFDVAVMMVAGKLIDDAISQLNQGGKVYYDAEKLVSELMTELELAGAPEDRDTLCKKLTSDAGYRNCKIVLYEDACYGVRFVG